MTERGLRCLIVLDDVWEAEVVRAFEQTGLCVLVTTRQAAVARASVAVIARRMLAAAAGLAADAALPAVVAAVLTACAGLL